MARQPEVAGSVQTAMIISAALVEGVTFFALIVCLLSIFFKYLRTFFENPEMTLGYTSQ